MKGTELTAKLDLEGIEYMMKLKMVKMISLGDIYSQDKTKHGIVLSFFNKLLKNFFYQIDYT